MDGSSFVPAEPVHIFLTNIQWLLSMSQTWITAVSCLYQSFTAYIKHLQKACDLTHL